MSTFIAALKEEEARSITEARQMMLTKEPTKRKNKYIINDKEILEIIKVYDRFESDKDIVVFLSRMSNHLQEFQAHLTCSDADKSDSNDENEE